MRSGIKWQFQTAKLRITLEVRRDHGYRYDGDDEDGETQAKLDSGEYVAFDTAVTVTLRETGETIGADYLGGSVYADGEESQFWTAHRGSDPMDRNCSIMRAKRGPCIICHYFPDMVRTALAEARETIRLRQNSLPRLRSN